MFQGFLRAAALSAAFLATSAHGGTVVLNEVMASNSTTIADAAGTYADWIELYNAGSDSADLTGFGLTDDPARPFKWVFPPVSLAPDSFLLVWASNKNMVDSTGALHTNFAISAGGETIVLTRPDGVVQDSLPAVALTSDMSYGRTPDGGATLVFFTSATPGARNTLGSQPVLNAPSFSHEAGFYATGFELGIATDQPGVTIRYTLDGSEPTETSPVYSSPLRIENRTGPASGNLLIRTTNPYNAWYTPEGWVFRGTAVRAKAFRAGYVPSPTVTGTYFVDPSGRARYPFPVISLVTDSLNLFGADEGIYVTGTKYAQTGVREDANFFQKGGEWERPVHVELFECDGSVAISQDAGVRIHGNYSRDYHQKSLRLYAKSSYGLSWFNHRFFPDGDVTQFKRILLRTGASDLYTALIRDGVAQGLVSHPNLDTQHHRPAAVFINGDYWGLQFIRDRYDEYYVSTYYGADPSAVDMLEIDYSLPGGFEVDAGDGVAFQEMISYTKSNSAASPAVYEHFKTLVDVENFAQYCAANIFVANTDWPHKNVRVWRTRTPYTPGAGRLDGRWRWMVYDLDRGFGLRTTSQATSNTLIWATIGNPTQEATWLLRWLLLNPDFRALFINTLADQMNSTFTVPRMIHMIDSLEAELTPGMAEHLRRWGGVRQAPSSVSQWKANVQVLRNFALARKANVVTHMRDFFSLGDSAAITVDLAGPSPACGTVRVNSIVLEPKPVHQWRGTYFTGMPVRLVATPKPGYVFVGWESAGGVISFSDTLSVSLSGDTTLTARFASATDVADAFSPLAFALQQNVPNPFNPGTTIRFALPAASRVRLAVYDVNGRLVRNLADANFEAGTHSIAWDGCDGNGRAAASGVYLVRLTARDGVLTRRMTLVR